jgi:hypothetical protein
VVAKKVAHKVRTGQKVILGEIIRESGYSMNKSLQPSRVTNTVAYKKEMEQSSRPLIEGLQKEISRIKDALAKKNYNNEEVRVLVASLDVLTRNYQLLSGGATERQVFVLPSEVMNKNSIQQSSEDVKSLNDKNA